MNITVDNELYEFVQIALDTVEGTANVYWNRLDAVIITDSEVIEIYPDPDEDKGFVADRTTRLH